MSARRGRIAAVVLVVCLVVVIVVIATSGGGSDGPVGFLSATGERVTFVQWTRIGDDVSGAVSEAREDESDQVTVSFTGTVRDDSVRLQIGSGTATARINARLDGDTLELTLPQDDGGVQTLRLTSASKGDYTQAVQNIRDRERKRQEDAQAAADRELRAVTSAVTPVATAFQKALDSASSDDPCRYMRPQLRRQLVSGADGNARSGYGPTGRSCARIVRYYESDLNEGPQGVAHVQVSDPSPPDATVIWRQDSSRVRLEAETPFTKENGRWLVYHCCEGLLGEAGQ
jgi:hypothetical protein